MACISSRRRRITSRLKPEQEAHLVRAAPPVLGGERVGRDPLDADVDAPAHDVEQLRLAVAVALDPRQTPLVGPPAVAVHDQRDVVRHQLGRDVGRAWRRSGAASAPSPSGRRVRAARGRSSGRARGAGGGSQGHSRFVSEGRLVVVVRTLAPSPGCPRPGRRGGCRRGGRPAAASAGSARGATAGGRRRGPRCRGGRRGRCPRRCPSRRRAAPRAAATSPRDGTTAPGRAAALAHRAARGHREAPVVALALDRRSGRTR